MKVLHVYRTYFPETQGGLEEAIRQICANTGDQGVECRVFTISHQPKADVLQLPEAAVHRFPLSFEIASNGVSLASFSGFKRLVEWADIVHYHFPWPFADLLHFATRVRKPSILTYHSDIVRQQGWLRCYRPLKRRFLAGVNRIVATSPNYADSSKVLNRFRQRVEIIPIGLNRATYPEVTREQLEKVEQRVGRDYFLFIGVLRYYKGLHILLQAMQGAPYQAVIVGTGPVEKELKALAEELRLDNVHFLGFVPDAAKVALLHYARALVLPSQVRSEAFGVSLLEGAMFARPLISVEIGSGMSYVNAHGVTGLTVPPGNPKALRGAMDTLYNAPQKAGLMGEQARRRYEELFTGRTMGESYKRLYKQMLKD